MFNYHIIILNLERSTERKKILEDQFIKIGLNNYTFWPGFDASYIKNIRFNAPIIKGVGIGRDLSQAEICIIMTQISALKHAQVMKYENVVILEDDVIICEDWENRIIKLLKSLPKDWEHVYLAGKSNYVRIPMYEIPTIINAPKMEGAFSYVVNKNSISKIIKYCNEIITTYDDMIMHKIESNKLKSYLYLPFMTYHSPGKSTNWGTNIEEHTSKNYFRSKILNK